MAIWGHVTEPLHQVDGLIEISLPITEHTTVPTDSSIHWMQTANGFFTGFIGLRPAYFFHSSSTNSPKYTVNMHKMLQTWVKDFQQTLADIE